MSKRFIPLARVGGSAILACTALMVSLLAPSTPAFADDISPVKIAALSAQLFAKGVADTDPLLVLSAAKLRRQIDLTESPAALENGSAPATDARGQTWQDMLATAKDMAGDDPVFAEIADQIEFETSRGVTIGQVYSKSRVSAGGEDTYAPLPYQPHDYAEVYVEAQGIDLNIAVHDAAGRLVCADTDISPIAYCGWTPATADQFTITVQNKGRADADYILITN